MSSVELLAERLGEAADRQTFLQRAGAATLGAVLALAGRPSDASAHCCHQYDCCRLCNVNNKCNAAHVWCWSCCGADGRDHTCCEGYSSHGACDGRCAGTICSWVNVGVPGSCHEYRTTCSP